MSSRANIVLPHEQKPSPYTTPFHFQFRDAAAAQRDVLTYQGAVGG